MVERLVPRVVAMVLVLAEVMVEGASVVNLVVPTTVVPTRDDVPLDTTVVQVVRVVE